MQISPSFSWKNDLTPVPIQAENSFSTIAVAGKSEQLDITKTADNIEEITGSNESHLNLFHLETPSYDESYLNLFKSPEEKMYEDMSGAKRPLKGYLNFTYLGEASDSESCEEISRNLIEEEKPLEETESKPKIIDFVPLDEATKPVFKKENVTYDTLEREKAFHVLNTAASSGAVRKSVSSIEHRASKPISQSGSRVSFNAAKKVFENLAGSNHDSDKPKGKGKEPNETEGRKSQGVVKETS